MFTCFYAPSTGRETSKTIVAPWKNFFNLKWKLLRNAERKIYEKQIIFVFDQEFVKIGISSFSALFTNV